MASAVHFRDAVSLAGRFPLLSGANLDVELGEVVHLRGPNGAGKTSLLRAVAGLVPISSGEAVVLGFDLRTDRLAVRREVGIVGHATFLYDDLSAEENVRFALRAARRDLAMLAPALERLGLVGRVRSTRAAALSAGQRRRVALATIVAKAPRLWLLDEPHAGLDVEGRAVLDEVVGEAAENGATVLVASHDSDSTSRIATRVVDVSGGLVHPESGDVSERRRPSGAPREVARDVA